MHRKPHVTRVFHSLHWAVKFCSLGPTAGLCISNNVSHERELHSCKDKDAGFSNGADMQGWNHGFSKRVEVAVQGTLILPMEFRGTPVVGVWGSSSASSADLAVPQTRLQTVGDRAFSVAAAKTWNSLPSEVTSSVTLSTFKQKLKTYLFSLSFPGT